MKISLSPNHWRLEESKFCPKAVCSSSVTRRVSSFENWASGHPHSHVSKLWTARLCASCVKAIRDQCCHAARWGGTFISKIKQSIDWTLWRFASAYQRCFSPAGSSIGSIASHLYLPIGGMLPAQTFARNHECRGCAGHDGYDVLRHVFVLYADTRWMEIKVVDPCDFSQVFQFFCDFLRQRSCDKPRLHSWLMETGSCSRRQYCQFGQGTQAIRRTPFLQQGDEVQTGPGTLLFQHAVQRSPNGSLLPMDEQLYWSFQLQILPTVSCIHRRFIKLVILCHVEGCLWPSVCTRNDSDNSWMCWISWIACFCANSFLRLSRVDAVQKHDHNRILREVGSGKLHLTLWCGSLDKLSKCPGRKCPALVSTCALHTWRWNIISQSLLDEVIYVTGRGRLM